MDLSGCCAVGLSRNSEANLKSSSKRLVLFVCFALAIGVYELGDIYSSATNLELKKSKTGNIISRTPPRQPTVVRAKRPKFPDLSTSVMVTIEIIGVLFPNRALGTWRIASLVSSVPSRKRNLDGSNPRYTGPLMDVEMRFGVRNIVILTNIEVFGVFYTEKRPKAYDENVQFY